MERLEQCHMLVEEYMLLKALVLTNSDVRVLDNQTLLRLRQDILLAMQEAQPTLRSVNLPYLLLYCTTYCTTVLRYFNTVLRYWLWLPL